MTAPKPHDSRDWVAIRRAYEHGEETIREICVRFGVTKGSLENRYRKERWISRLANKANRQRSTLGRLFAVLERQVTKLANTSGETLGDKEAQQLTELIKNFDKISTIANEETKVDAPREKRDMRDIRDKLAKRIDQFNRR
ncbi:hypothetical protein [Devosia lacusdianchii]|uniref:hypothetical protein n=1 Tax=Devosia lacusdianchii TaxID=2917991 RepID=UPI001F0673F4|nr:hypothetical protein [Devosia sp. JXJ CY 41]